jgi:hypothetical protein
MGVEQMDIISELSKRSMHTIIDHIYSYLSVTDIVRVGCVSKEWRGILKETNKTLYKHRGDLIKQKRKEFNRYKENRKSLDKTQTMLPSCPPLFVDDEKRSVVSCAEKRELFNRFKTKSIAEWTEKQKHLGAQTTSTQLFKTFDLNSWRSVEDAIVKVDEIAVVCKEAGDRRKSSLLGEDFLHATSSLCLAKDISSRQTVS